MKKENSETSKSISKKRKRRKSKRSENESEIMACGRGGMAKWRKSASKE
jgi:hypothetical protein